MFEMKGVVSLKTAGLKTSIVRKSFGRFRENGVVLISQSEVALSSDVVVRKIEAEHHSEKTIRRK